MHRGSHFQNDPRLAEFLWSLIRIRYVLTHRTWYFNLAYCFLKLLIPLPTDNQVTQQGWQHLIGAADHIEQQKVV